MTYTVFRKFLPCQLSYFAFFRRKFSIITLLQHYYIFSFAYVISCMFFIFWSCNLGKKRKKQKRTPVFGRASVFSDFKLTRENDDLLSLWHKLIFKEPHPVQEYIIIQIPNKRYQTNTVHNFWSTLGTSALRNLGVDHFGSHRTKIYRKEEKL